MQGANLIIECLIKEGVTTMFGYPGGSVIPIYDALYDYTDKIKHIRTSHEQGAVHAADGYARTSGKTGVCVITSGPGATNAVTGIATAYMDSSPLVVISGQVGTSLLGKDTFQEIDITGVTYSITKHNFLVRNLEELPNIIREAFIIANEGRKGPVLIDIPKNLQVTDLDYNMDDYVLSCQNVKTKDEFQIKEEHETKSKLKYAADLIKEAKKPVIYAGGGVKSVDQYNLLKDFAEKINTPVLNTLMGLGGIDREDPLSLGLVGMHGSKEANLAISNADLVISIGARFSDRVIGNKDEFAKNAKVIQLDIDSSEISKNIPAEVALVGDLTDVLNGLLDIVEPKDNSEWLAQIDTFKDTEHVIDKDAFHPKNILEAFNKKLGSKNTTVVTDVGQHQMWTAQYWKFEQGRSYITSGGLGTMGFGLGGAIGTKLGTPQKNVLLVTGDGSFKMNCNELATVATQNLPIVILLFNNNALGMVRQWQNLFSHKRYSETDIYDKTNYIMLANAYGIEGHKAQNLEELNEILDNLTLDKPVLVECQIDHDINVFPIVPPNDNLLNLICN
ncbi:MAG: biosynthetic-type acetolactate synthase large subunit [Intestinibacter bartlettii]|uniref:biosynthetic-type acetolactate synthase large subunit n=1 Tax=Intestinibacter bartlettii TaxID=261299 RepID=UPI0026EAA12C|nr:biosynthetic-type acetolactate synthase large subunit [Intestinibacter bartlettii]MDO5010352.1 biosynthetic-type acetolactate synthase large subunit [Intestinibacter bartlettii]